MEPQLSSSSTTSLDNLPRETIWRGTRELVQWEGFWYIPGFLAGAMAARSHFVARNEDVILASSIKTGTTWLKAIIPCLMNLGNGDNDYDPFPENHPNELMPSLELQIFSQDSKFDILAMPSPRLFRTHMPFSTLPNSIKNSASKIVYITRNPKDVFVSMWHFLNSYYSFPCPLNDAFESFCKGIHPFGPFHDHVLGYWEESVKRPQKILFLKYEELKNDPIGQVQKLASFLGRPYVKEEEIEKLLEKCNFERLKNLEINKHGVDPHVGVAYKSYFRLGLVGDWKNYFTDEMKERLDKITKMKLEGSGLEL